jgi:putative peptidoglycan lipid II flippase
VFAMTLNLLFSVAFTALFNQVGLAPHGGLALANSLATALEMGGLLVLMRRRLNGLDGKKILAGAGQAGIATLAMSLGLWFWLLQTGDNAVGLVMGLGVILGAGIYGLSTLVLGVKEARGAAALLYRRLLGV